MYSATYSGDLLSPDKGGYKMDFPGKKTGKTSVTSNSINTMRGHVRKHPHQIAIKTEDRSETYQEMWERCTRLANALLDLGKTKTDRLITYMPNCFEYVEIIVATNMAGIPMTLGNFRLTGDEIAYQINDCGASVIFLQKEQLDVIVSIRDKIPQVETIILIGAEAEGTISYETFLAGGSNQEPNVEVLPEDLHLLFYTSGTTGLPKGAARSMFCDYNMGISTIIEMGLRRDDSFLIVAPMYAAATAGYMFSTLLIGGTVLVVPAFIPENTLRIIDTYRPSCVFMVPIMYDWMLSLPPETLAKYDLSSVRQAVACGAPMHTTIFQKVYDNFKNAECSNMLGCSELGFVTRITVDEWLKQGKANSIGKAMFDMELRIIDEKGQDVKPGEVGNLYGRSPQLWDGYWNNPAGTQEAFLDHEWGTVGDMARMDEDGYIYLVDRAKDMIVSGGTNIYPAEIEGVLLQMDGIADVGVIGVPDEKWGESVKAVVVLKPGYSLSEEDIIEFCRQRLAGFKIPKSVDYIDVIPRNAVGKMLKKDLRKKYWAGHDKFIS